MSVYYALCVMLPHSPSLHFEMGNERFNAIIPDRKLWLTLLVTTVMSVLRHNCGSLQALRYEACYSFNSLITN